MQLKASAPGSLMLLGEYAVLYGKFALACAVDRRITVTLTPRVDDKIEIQSSLHGYYSTTLSQIQVEKPFHFVLGALQQCRPSMRRGCIINIESELSDKVGFGSSAAVIVATLATLFTWLNVRLSPLDLVRQGRLVVRQIQGIGSGADIAASVYGGMVAYQAQPLAIEKFLTLHPLIALYAGFKTPTAEAIKQVQRYFSAHPQLFRQLTNGIGQCAMDGIHCVRQKEWSKLGEIMNIQQGMMESLGVSTLLLHDMVHDLRKQSGIMGAKISGSGLGDCVIGLGDVSPHYTYANHHSGVQRIPIEMTQKGVQCEKI